MINKSIPKAILKDNKYTKLSAIGLSEKEAFNDANSTSKENILFSYLIGEGFYNVDLPAVIKRQILEKMNWYSAYTPYQAEISQGRLEMLLYFQHIISDLTQLEITNSSLLDEASSLAEAITMANRYCRDDKKKVILLDKNIFKQVKNVVKTKAKFLDLEVVECEVSQFLNYDLTRVFVACFSYPNNLANLTENDLLKITKSLSKQGIINVFDCDLLSLLLIKSPKLMGADIAIGSSQIFGQPIGFGGPHAAFISCIEKFKRLLPGRIIGKTIDRFGKVALRMALQTREQHIRRGKATSNICTAQVLPAVLAAAYVIYTGKEQLIIKAKLTHALATKFDQIVAKQGWIRKNKSFTNTLFYEVEDSEQIYNKILSAGYEINLIDRHNISISFDFSHNLSDIALIATSLTGATISSTVLDGQTDYSNLPTIREDNILADPIFSNYTSELAFSRLITKLESKDLTLNKTMIPLGSCTMKLNPATSLNTITLEGFSKIHPFTNPKHCLGYQKLVNDLKQNLKDLTGYDEVSLQPNAGSVGEYAGLIAIKQYFYSRGDENRKICLIPNSAHGTNPASAVLAGFDVVEVETMPSGEISKKSLLEKIDKFSNQIAAIMITYPSTHGVFEDSILEVTSLVHEAGGQVYLDGANFNAMVGIIKPADLGADVGHLNLHKTFAIPHGGGGPGMGPVCVKKHLIPFLPQDPRKNNAMTVASAEFSSASILAISNTFIKMLGLDGLAKSSKVAILNANYIANKLKDHYPLLYSNDGYVAHECLLDCRDFEASTGVNVEDIAKRLIDYGFHAPTISFPKVGTIMIEPTESEPKEELDRFIKAMLLIRNEISQIENGSFDKVNNPLKNAPHTAGFVLADKWDLPYSRLVAAFPLNQFENKYWPTVARINQVYGDQNLQTNIS